MTTTLTHELTFPVITSIVKKAKGKVLTTDEIAAQLIGNPKIGPKVREVAKERGDTWQNVAINSVAWFSQKYTTSAGLAFDDDLDRCKVNGKWAYSYKG